MADNVLKERFSIFRRGTVLGTKGKEEVKHISDWYDLVSDKVDEDGNRILTLKPKDLTKKNEIIEEMVDTLMEKLDESSDVLAGIIRDALVDYEEEDLAKMLKDIKGGKKKIKATEGCFKIVIGDGRRTNSHAIMLRE